MNEIGGGVPSPGKSPDLSEGIGLVIGLVIAFAVLALLAGFCLDVIEWSWNVGRSIIN